MIVRLVAGDVTLEVDPTAGGRLSSLLIGGRERLITQPDPSAILPEITWGSFAMLPWVGRMRGGRLDWRGVTAQLKRTFGAHAIHGATFDRAWDVLSADDRSVDLGCRLRSTEWPFGGDARQSIRLTSDGLDCRIEIRATEPMPVAVGWHPWFCRYGSEPMMVTVPAAAVLETTDELIPTGGLRPVDGTTDLRGSPLLGDRRLDHAYVGVTGPCAVAWPDLVLTIDARPVRAVVVYTTPASVCIEPQSAWPDAIRLEEEGVDAGLASLAAGEVFACATRWSWRAPGGA